MREAIYSLKRQAIAETSPSLNSFIRKTRFEMKENLARISKEVEDARNAKASASA